MVGKLDEGARQISFTRFPRANIPRGKRASLTVTDFLDQASQRIKPYSEAKEDHPLISLATYKNDYRKASNVESLSGVQFDFDDVDWSALRLARTMIDEFCLASAIFSTWKHRRPGYSGRFRVILLGDRQISADEYPLVWEGLADQLDFREHVDSCNDVSRGFFVAVELPGSFSRAVVGRPFDVDLALQRGVAIQNVEEASATGGVESGNEDLVDADIETLRGALSVIPADDRELWIKVGLALKAAGHPDSYELFQEWSAKSEKFDCEDESGLSGSKMCKVRWEGFQPRDITHRSIYFIASKYGWRNPTVGRKTTYEEVMKEIRALHVNEKLCDTDSWCELVFEAGLDEAARRRVIQYVASFSSDGAGVQILTRVYREFERRRKAEDTTARTNSETRGRGKVVPDPASPQQNLHLTEQEVMARSIPNSGNELVIFGGLPVRVSREVDRYAHSVVVGEEAPETKGFTPYNFTSMTLLLNRTVQFVEISDQGEQEVHPPHEIVRHMLENPAPNSDTATGLVQTPFISPEGDLVSSDGFHPSTGLWLACKNDLKGISVGDDQKSARESYAAICDTLFSEFPFDEPLDQAAAVGLLITLLQRKMFSEAPLILVNARQQSTGKTALARLCYITATGHEMPVYPMVRDTDETRKQLHSILMRNPTAVCLDNIADGDTLGGATLAEVLTNPVFSARRLGVSEIVPVPTNVTFIATGNNIALDADMAAGRTLEIRLDAHGCPVHDRKFQVKDLRMHASKNRRKMISAALTIVNAYIRAGQPEVVEGSHRMQEWSKCVQSSIAWASGVDIGQSFERTREESSGNAEREHLLLLLHEQFGARRFTSAEVYELMKREHGSIRASERLQAAITAKSPVRAVGRAIGQLVGGYYGDGSRALTRKKVNGQTVFQVQTKGPIAFIAN